MKKLFTNVVMAKASKEQVLTILENPETLLQWVPEVQTVTQAANAFTVHRLESNRTHRRREDR